MKSIWSLIFITTATEIRSTLQTAQESLSVRACNPQQAICSSLSLWMLLTTQLILIVWGIYCLADSNLQLAPAISFPSPREYHTDIWQSHWELLKSLYLSSSAKAVRATAEP